MTDHELEGTWDVVLSVAAGEEGATPAGTYLKIEGDYFERNTPNHIFTRTIVVNKDTTPYEIDLHITNEPDKGKTFLGIYKVEGNTLSIAHALPGNPRPSQFESTAANKQILSVSKKQ